MKIEKRIMLVLPIVIIILGISIIILLFLGIIDNFLLGILVGMSSSFLILAIGNLEILEKGLETINSK